MTLRQRFNQLPLARKLRASNIIIIVPILIIVAATGVFFVAKKQRNDLQDKITSISNLTEKYMVSDLLFDDQESAQNTLDGLEALPNIKYAHLSKNDGSILAFYGDTTFSTNISNKKEVYFEFSRFIHRQSIQYKGDDLGSLLIIASTKNFQRSLAFIIISVLGALIGAIVLAFWLSNILQRLIAKPIIELAETTELVSQTNNYNIRAKNSLSLEDEVGTLYKEFNQMLSTIESTTVSKGYLDSMLSSLAELLIVIDKDSKILSINSSVTKTTGYTEAELLGQSIELLLPNNPTTTWRSAKTTDAILIEKDGGEMYASISVTPLQGSPQQQEQTILSIRDITAQRMAEEALTHYTEQLERSNKELEKLSYITSHDLKAPLRSIGSLASFIEDDLKDKFTPETRSYFDLIKTRIERAFNLIDGILEYSKIGRIEDVKEWIDTQQVVQDITEMYMTEKQVQFDIPKNLPSLYANSTKIYQIFANLISNAIKYNDKEQCMTKVSFTEDQERYTFAVQDNGPGIEQKHFDRIFEVFQTLNPRDKVESIGVGLSIIQKIIQQENGKVWVESELGTGTTFFFTWPKHSRTDHTK